MRACYKRSSVRCGCHRWKMLVCSTEGNGTQLGSAYPCHCTLTRYAFLFLALVKKKFQKCREAVQ